MTLCSPVIAELRFGAMYGNDPIKESTKVESFIAKFPCIDFDEPSTREYASIRLDLTRRGMLIPDMDLEIASIALAYKLTLVTHNTADFSRIPGLILEDWEIP